MTIREQRCTSTVGIRHNICLCVASPTTAALSHRQPASADKYRANCRTRGSDKRDTMRQLTPQIDTTFGPQNTELLRQQGHCTAQHTLWTAQQLPAGAVTAYLYPVLLASNFKKSPVSVHRRVVFPLQMGDRSLSHRLLWLIKC